MATINLGAIKFNWKGAYNNSTAYAVDDVVSSGGSSYVCILASTGNAVSNGTYWSVMAQAGTNGTDVGTTLTTQGDILYRDGSGLQRLGAGTNGQALLTGGAGANPSWGDAGGGKILQVIEDLSDVEFETTSTSFVTTGLSVNITPSATSSKVLIMASPSFDNKSNTNYNYVTIYRDSTNLAVGNEGMQIAHMNDGSRLYNGMPVMKLDSPNTTSQVTYAVYVRTSGSTLRVGQHNLRQSIVVMEVGA